MLFLQLYLPVLCLLFLVEDLRHRAVHWSLFAQAFLCFGVFGLFTLGRRHLLAELPVNLTFLALLMTGVVLYCRLRAGRWVNPLHGHMGAGDVLFLLACTPLFPRHAFAIFVVSGSLFALLAYGVLRVLMPRQPATVPSAGLMALYLGTWLVLERTGVVSMRAVDQWLAHG